MPTGQLQAEHLSPHENLLGPDLLGLPIQPPGPTTSSDMNPLLVPELFHCVLDHLAIPPPEDEDGHVEYKTLAALARTCHAFSEPSLDYLWRRLDSFVPLLRSFSDVVDDARVRTLPSPLEWRIINRYSHRIQELTLGTERLSLDFLEHANPDLPNLAVLRWKCHTLQVTPGRLTPFRSIAILRSLLTPKIDSLEAILSNDRDPYAQSFLEDFSRLCPNLRSIKLDITSSSGRVSEVAKQALSRAICGRAHWRRVEVRYPLDRAALKHLGESPTLKAVSLTAGPAESCFEQEDTPFCNVTKLALKLQNDLGFAIHLLRAHEQAFCSFKVTIADAQTTPADISSLLIAIASPERIHSLQSLEVACIRNTHLRDLTPTNDTQELSYTHISPIASLVHLRTLVIHFNHPVGIDDAEFSSLVCNWPCLEDLQLIWWGDEYPAKRITLIGLLSLLASCRGLCTIRMSIDARQVPSDACSDVCSPSVLLLLLFDSPIEDPEPVEEFLAEHLPCASFFHLSLNHGLFGDVGQEYGLMWLRVMTSILSRTGVGLQRNRRALPTLYPGPHG